MTDGKRTEPKWLGLDVALAIHDRQIAEHGGLVGLRVPGMLESALARPVNQWAYGEDDPAKLAAAYAFGIARNHPFSDGNKRTAWVLARLFLRINHHEPRFDVQEAIETVLDLAAGKLAEDALANWFRERLAF